MIKDIARLTNPTIPLEMPARISNPVASQTKSSGYHRNKIGVASVEVRFALSVSNKTKGIEKSVFFLVNSVG